MARHRWLAFLLLLPTIVLAKAQWYEVEVLAFAYDNPAVSTETWPALSGFPELSNAATLLNSNTPETLLGIRRLPKNERDFNDSYKNINYSDKTHVLFHEKWEQYINDEKNLSIRLHGGKRIVEPVLPSRHSSFYSLERPAFSLAHAQMVPEYLLPPYPWEIEGTIEMRLSRYMHVDTDFVYQTVDGQAIRARGNAKMRSKEVHYVDHPYFGLLIRIDRKTN
ncbi:MAG: hypothetical protein CMF48_06660 [Legionellales bacterium]|nr:hypothetical protein [Legionellales bacterium]|tara:strand:- start:327 stop:992 length:666 start_codon:yes stop_codon:yes gene_type:complete